MGKAGTAGRVLGLLAALGAPAARAAAPADAAAEHLLGALADARRAPLALRALLASRDPNLVPLFAALSRSAAEPQRRMGVAALGRLKGDEAAAALRRCARTDDSPELRTRALAILLDLQAADEALLTEAMGSSHERLRLLGARGLVAAGRGPAAEKALTDLAKSPDPATAAMARTSLLGLGRREHYAHLRALLHDPNTPQRTIDALCAQIGKEKIRAGLDIVESLAAAPARPDARRLAACRALVDASDRGAAKLLAIIRKSERPAFAALAFQILALRDDVQVQLAALASRADVVGAMARFELVRPGGGKAAAKAAADLVDCGHPLAVGYLLSRAAQDIEARAPAAAVYRPVLVKLVADVPPRGMTLRQEHTFAAGAAKLLGDLGTPEALAALKGFIRGRQREPRRAALGGLASTTNRRAALLARPLLASPYDELATTAAMALGRFAEPAAAEKLARIVAHPRRRPPQVAFLAAWYLLKVRGRTPQFLERAAETLRKLQ
jgi:hypothetical protein